VKYQISKKFLSYSEAFSITYEAGGIAYWVYPETFSSRHKFSFMDANKNKLGYVYQKLESSESDYKIVVAGVYFGKVVWVNKGFSFREKFKLKINGAANCCVKRYLWKNEFKFFRNGGVVAKITKHSSNWKDSYFVEFSD